MYLSIIIPHYNLPRDLLARCIDSIISLQLPGEDFEAIIVDDGSQEPPLWLKKQYPDNIKLITATHSGPGGARNRGIEEARGKYIQFLDADDYLLPNGEIKQCIAKLHEEEPHILRFNYHVCHNEKSKIPAGKKNITFSNTISGAGYMRHNNLPGSPCCYFFKRELAIKKNITFPTEMLHEDEEFNTILHYHAQSLVVSDATPYCYCIREGSTTANSSTEFESKRLEDIFKVISHISEFRNNHAATSNPIQKEALKRKLEMLAVDAILNMLYAGMSAKEIAGKCHKELSPLALYPLPEATHSLKYRIFRKLANSSFGLSFLRLITPKKKPLKR